MYSQYMKLRLYILNIYNLHGEILYCSQTKKYILIEEIIFLKKKYWIENNDLFMIELLYSLHNFTQQYRKLYH